MFQRLRFYLVIASLLVVFGCNLSGTISENGTPLGDVTVTLSGPSSVSTITDSNGEFAFNFIRQGTYTVTPALPGYYFTPETKEVNITTSGVTDLFFEGTSLDEVENMPPGEPGPYHVGNYMVQYEHDFGTYHARICYPAKYDGKNAPAVESSITFPGIAVAGGGTMVEWEVRWIFEHLASHGYITICFTPPNPFLLYLENWEGGFDGGIAKLMDENSEDSMIHGLLNTEKFGVIGLSMGGGGCIRAINPDDNEAIDAAVALAPATWEGTLEIVPEVNVPTMLQVGSMDNILTLANSLTSFQKEMMDQYFFGFWPFPWGEINGDIYYLYDLIPDSTPKSYVEIYGGNHVGFFNELIYDYDEILYSLYDVPLSFIWSMLDSEPAISLAEQHYISKKYFTAWFQYFLKDLDEYGIYIFGEEAENDLTTGVLTDGETNLPYI